MDDNKDAKDAVELNKLLSVNTDKLSDDQINNELQKLVDLESKVEPIGMTMEDMSVVSEFMSRVKSLLNSRNYVPMKYSKMVSEIHFALPSGAKGKIFIQNDEYVFALDVLSSF